MIRTVTILLGFQLLGEVIARGLGLIVPGPVIGMALLLALLWTRPRLAGSIMPTAQGLLAHLSLLFVPAGVGVVGHAGALGAEGPAIVIALVASTVLAIAVGALVFTGVARLTGDGDD
ncbi:CidA/LrgA family protein [Rhodovulum sp. YNF3179]|uniref:CidA/LrgA family protein n=1 Tax=Rhodovulum sp. YNF3179 TaxID=3425127 RepID=UPI003D34F265